jgi:TRAP-type C4-dicarboxylate transport system substrate-binding protein
MFVRGSASLCFAAAGSAKAAKPARAKAAAALEETRDMRMLFGHNVEGLEPVTLRWVCDSPHGSGGDVILTHVAALIEAESKGKIKIDLHRFGALYKSLDLPKVIPIGTVHMGNINKGLLLGREIGYAPWIIAFRWMSPEHMLAVTCSPEWYEMEERLSKNKWNMKHLVLTPQGNWDYFSRKEIKSLKDLQGVRIWSSGEITSTYVKSWGATPVMKAWSEVYMAYYKGEFDVLPFNVQAYLSRKMYECGKYWLHMPHFPPGSVGIHMNQEFMNRDKWNSLPLPYKKIILDALDLYSWVAIWETVAMEKLSEYRLIHQYKIVNVDIAGKHPQEYEKIKQVAVEEAKKMSFARGVKQEQWDEVQAIINKYNDPKHTAKYKWWFKLAWAEADRRLARIQKDLAAGKSWDEAYEPEQAKNKYGWSVDRIKQHYLSVPRVKYDWNEATRLQ